MATIVPDYLKTLQSDPEQPVSAIIRIYNDPQANTAQLANLGLTVTQTFSLVPGLAVTGPAKGVVALLDEPWVISIEQDQPVHTTM